MNEAPISEVLARRFLLGECEDFERERIESLFVVDPAVKETILTAEQELIDDFLDKSLSGREREQFVRQYQATARLRHSIELAESLKSRGLAQTLFSQPPSVLERCRRLFSLHWPGIRPLFIPATAALILLLIIAAVWLVRWNNSKVRERNQEILIADELAELNSPGRLQQTPPQMASLLLSPVTVRSLDRPGQTVPASGNNVIELRLLWMRADNNEQLHASIRHAGATDTLSVSNLSVETISGMRIVRLRLPVHLVTHGQYQVTLSSSAENRTSVPDEEYIFTVD